MPKSSRVQPVSSQSDNIEHTRNRRPEEGCTEGGEGGEGGCGGVRGGEVTNVSEIDIDTDYNWTNVKVKLKREISLISAMGIITSAMIGSGIFMSPVAIVLQCKSVGLSLVIWVVSGLVSVMMSLCYIELGLVYPVAGGRYSFTRAINGELCAFLYAYSTMIAGRPCYLAMVAKVTVDYFYDAFIPGCEHNEWLRNILAAWLLVTVVAMNSLSTKGITVIQNIFAAMKIGALSLVILFGFIHIFRGNTDNFQEPFKNSEWTVIAISLGIYYGLYSFSGWYIIYDLMEDLKTPEKVAPRSSVYSILMMTVIYLGTNVAYFSTMDADEMSRSSAVALSFAKVTMGSFSKIIPILIVFSSIGTLSTSLIASSRVVFAQSRDGLLPDIGCLLQVNYRVPWLSSWFECFLTCVYIFLFNLFDLFDYMMFTTFIFEILAYANVVILRYTKPDVPRPFKVWLIIPILVTGMISTMAISGAIKSPLNFLISQIQVASGLPIYAFVYYLNKHPKLFYNFRHKINSTFQKILLVTYPEKE